MSFRAVSMWVRHDDYSTLITKRADGTVDFERYLITTHSSAVTYELVDTKTISRRDAQRIEKFVWPAKGLYTPRAASKLLILHGQQHLPLTDDQYRSLVEICTYEENVELNVSLPKLPENVQPVGGMLLSSSSEARLSSPGVGTPDHQR